MCRISSQSDNFQGKWASEEKIGQAKIKLKIIFLRSSVNEVISKLSAGGKFIRRRNPGSCRASPPFGGRLPEVPKIIKKRIEFSKFFLNFTVPKPTHSTQHYINTLPKTYPTVTRRVEDPSRLSDAIAYIIHEGLHPWLSCLPRYYSKPLFHSLKKLNLLSSKQVLQVLFYF